ncbi:SDR family NAD(P)-dependent oxidoreductase [Streptomyces sp. NPDC056749]|uniref:SDR family NAD(P)-dependent oxidoreductase n=1 Tax=Streptomyces sp. NPDC056749 TaxID=3345936 RepID=UPI0036865824
MTDRERTRPERAAEPDGSRHDDWLHELRWLPSPAPPADRAPEPGGSWLIFADDGPVSRIVTNSLIARGGTVTVVDGAQDADITRALDSLNSAADHQGIVYARALDAGPDTGSRGPVPCQAVVCEEPVRLAQALHERQTGSTPPLWLISQGAQAVRGDTDVTSPSQAPLWGLGRTLTTETPGLRTRLVDLDATAASADALAAELTEPGEEDQIALREGRRFHARLLRAAHTVDPAQGAPAATTRPGRLSVQEPGLIEDLTMIPVEPRELVGDDVLIRVSHAGLTYHDVLTSLGLPPWNGEKEPDFGFECAGRVEAVGPDVAGLAVGDEVVAAAIGSLATHVRARACVVTRVPDGLTAGQAVTIPSSFLSAYYALHTQARLGAGDRVLIHTATGGVGMAALQIARWKGAEVYATAGSERKRHLLGRLGVRHISDSRSQEFAEEFRADGAEGGMDVILNTLSGEAVRTNLSLLAPYGRYVELTQRDIVENTLLPLGLLADSRSVFTIDVWTMLRRDPERAAEVLDEIWDLVRRGVFEPLSAEEFELSDIGVAFQHMARAQHSGRIVIRFPASSAEPSPESPADRDAPGAAAGPLPLRPDATYLVTGGMGGLGRHLSHWLVDQGCTRLLLVGRSELDDDGREHLRRLENRGVDAAYAALDVAEPGALGALLTLRDHAGEPPVRGVFHLAGVLGHSSLTDVDRSELAQILHPKTAGAWELHRTLDEVDLFVLFSSAASQISSPFRGCYAAGNAFLDALGHYRRARGLPATVVNWGFWDEAGMTARWEEDNGRSSRPQGMRSFTPAEGMTVLEKILRTARPQTTPLPTDWSRWARAYPDAARSPLLRELTGVRPADNTPSRPVPVRPSRDRSAPVEKESASPGTDAPTERSTGDPDAASERIPTRGSSDGSTPADAFSRDAVERTVIGIAADVLGTPPERVRSRRPLIKQGMDSLMATQLRNRLQREFDVTLPITMLLKGATAATITDRITAPATDER